MKNILSATNFHIVGIKGTGMTPLALILADLGKKVTGSDIPEVFLTDQLLINRGISVFTPFDVKNVLSAEVIIYGAANGGKENIEVQEARRLGKRVVLLPEVLAELSLLKETISVCGCHGKTTTSALASFLGESLKLEPSYFVGAAGFGDKLPGQWLPKGKYFILESDEYFDLANSSGKPKFSYYSPTHILCTNIDFDHPDVYADLGKIKAAYLDFFKKLPQKGILLVCGDNRNAVETAKLSGHRFYRYGFSDDNDFKVVSKNDEHRLYQENQLLAVFKMSLIGKHNLLNIVGALSLYSLLGYDLKSVTNDLIRFYGVKRRLEKVFEKEKMVVFDDYAHHPAEIESGIHALKGAYSNSRLVVLFQPHTYSRTKALAGEFVRVLSQADTAIFLKTFPSQREQGLPAGELDPARIISMELDKLHKESFYVETDTELADLIAQIKVKHDRLVFVTMGAGDVYLKKELIINTE